MSDPRAVKQNFCRICHHGLKSDGTCWDHPGENWGDLAVEGLVGVPKEDDGSEWDALLRKCGTQAEVVSALREQMEQHYDAILTRQVEMVLTAVGMPYQAGMGATKRLSLFSEALLNIEKLRHERDDIQRAAGYDPTPGADVVELIRRDFRTNIALVTDMMTKLGNRVPVVGVDPQVILDKVKDYDDAMRQMNATPAGTALKLAYMRIAKDLKALAENATEQAASAAAERRTLDTARQHTERLAAVVTAGEQSEPVTDEK